MIAQVVLGLGLALLLAGGAGQLRMGSVYARLQASGVGDVGGAAVVLVGLLLAVGWRAAGPLAVVLLLLLVFTNPIATHAVAKGAFVQGVREEEEPWPSP
ncbi:MAG: monovalent cation/H(+) antiporter subunit G [Candidatus Bipolaricaulaceae bacterium]